MSDYLAGFLNEKEQEQLEHELKTDYELREELDSLEIALEHYANSTGVKPSTDFSATIWNSIHTDEKQDFVVGKVEKKFRIWSHNFGIAASVLLLLSVLGNIYLANKWQYQKNNFLTVLAEKNAVQQRLKETEKRAELTTAEVSLLKNPNIKVCKLISAQQNDHNALLLGIDMENNMQVMVMSPELPEKPYGHSYQLWAVSNTGIMVCMGTFDAEKKIYKMKKLPFTPKEFGVTIEEGEFGKPQPTSDFLVRGI